MNANTANTAQSVELSQKASHRVIYAANLASISLDDRTEEVGHYDRFVFSTTLDNWDKIATILAAARTVAAGSEKAVLTGALNRIPTEAKRAARAARVAARRAARRAARA